MRNKLIDNLLKVMGLTIYCCDPTTIYKLIEYVLNVKSVTIYCCDPSTIFLKDV